MFIFAILIQYAYCSITLDVHCDLLLWCCHCGLLHTVCTCVFICGEGYGFLVLGWGLFASLLVGCWLGEGWDGDFMAGGVLLVKHQRFC